MNNKEENLIKWEKWMDPFGNDEELLLDKENIHNEEENYDGDSAIENADQFSHRIKIKVMATPMGIIPINEHTASGKIFNFWVGHTNFNITKNIAQIIEETDGVETLDIFTRYRFRISVGKAFVDSVVMRDINTRSYEYLNEREE
jgi:hypothetical protein